MKRFIGVIMMCGVFAISSLHPVQAKAQTQKDSIAVITPIFSGNENSLTDTLAAYGKAITDPQLKAVVTDAVTTIKATPKDGSFESWYGWVIGVIGALLGVYQFIRAKLRKQENTALKTELLAEKTSKSRKQ